MAAKIIFYILVQKKNVVFYFFNNFTLIFLFLFTTKFTPALMHEGVARTNLIFGGFDSAARHVYSSHGEFDPWAAAGFKEDINEDSPTVILPGAAHCSDILSISEQDTPTMRAHKEKVFETIKRWIEESP